MSKGNKVIENPEVPGFEQNLPFPPPGLSESARIETETKESNGLQVTAVMSTAQSFSIPSPIINSPNFLSTSSVTMSPPQQQQQQIPSSQSIPLSTIPWWIPTEADSQDSFCSQWFDHNQKSCFITPSLPPPPPPPPLPPPTLQESSLSLPPHQQFLDKFKGNKRKNKDFDPAEDAERVASAQRELSALMKPLKCDLCNAVMNSTLQAKLHYDGKPHQKKVSMFLNQSVKKLKVEDGHVICTGETNDWNTYCSICKTWFTSQIDAAQHYAGKKHIKATTGTPKPKSQKKHTNSLTAVTDATGRFGIGLAFQSENQNLSSFAAPPTVPTVDYIQDNNISRSLVVGNSSLSIPQSAIISEPYISDVSTYGAALRCELCGVSANRFEQLETHRRGLRHQKMLKINGFNTAVTPDSISMVTSTPITATTITTTTTTTTTIIDYSIYRTPSGSYYCAPCNKSFSSENSFAQHVESKKHKNQVNPKSPVNQTTMITSTVSASKKDKSKKLLFKTP